MSTDWIKNALTAGFSHAAALDISTLTPRRQVRDMCAADRCNMFGKCWTCPPACGTLETCGACIRRFSTGLLVQSVSALADAFDYPGMLFAEQRHQEAFLAFYGRLCGAFGAVLALGAGGCRVCTACTYPDMPCRFPKRAVSSMEAYGLLVSDVCLANGLEYYHGAGTISYTGCYLLS